MNITTIGEKTIARPVARSLSEWRFVALTIATVLFLTSLPYLYAYLSAPVDRQFMGVMLDVPDHGQYFSWMRELAHAHLAANKLTPEANPPVFFNLLWWGLGRLGWLLGWSYPAVFQLLRFVASGLFLLLAYRLCAWFLEDRLMRRTAFLVIAFGSGFGWVLIGLKYLWQLNDPPYPLLVYIAEGNTFLGILGYPHFIGAALYIFVFDLVLRGQDRNQLRYAVYAGLVALFFGWQHAYDLVLVYGILGAYIVLKTLRDRRLPMYLIKSSLILGLISWWPALYSVLLTNLSPLWKEVLAQFANAGVYSPSPWQLPILLGPAFLLALFFIVRDSPFRLSRLDDKTLFLKTWFLANLLLIYIPTDYQVHMLNGWQVPIAILATLGLFRYVVPFVTGLISRWRGAAVNSPGRQEKIQKGLALAFILVVLPTNAYLLLWRFVDLGRHDYPYYLHRDEVAALAWLESNGTNADVALSSLTIGQYIPALTGKYAFLAHWAQTVDFYGKSVMVDEFFSDSTDDLRRQEILKQYSVDYIFYGPAERSLGQYQPDRAPFLWQVYDGSSVQVFQVQTGSID